MAVLRLARKLFLASDGWEKNPGPVCDGPRRRSHIVRTRNGTVFQHDLVSHHPAPRRFPVMAYRLHLCGVHGEEAGAARYDGELPGNSQNLTLSAWAEDGDEECSARIVVGR